jgi:hypothetical protein
MRMHSFGEPAKGWVTTLETAQAEQEAQSSIISGRSEMKTNFSFLIGVANAFVFQAIAFIAIFVVCGVALRSGTHELKETATN